jgi:hypothetical protein
MTQPLDLITDALCSIGALAPGEPLEPSLANQAFNMLNRMLDVWSNDSFMITSINEITATIGGGGTTWTIGPTGQINSQRPLGINSAFVRVAGIDYPVSVINVEQYELIGLKQLNGPWPRALYYNSGTPLGIINFWPNPSSGEIHLICDLLFTRFVTINDTIQFTPGYEMAIMWSLAALLMPAYGKLNPVQIQMVQNYAKTAIASIKGTNMQPQQTVQFDPALYGTGRVKDAGWIMNGGFH